MDMTGMRDWQHAILHDLAAAGGSLDAAALTPPKFHLFKNNVVVNDGTVLTDLTEADFIGYSAVAPVGWGTILNDPLRNRWYITPTNVIQFVAGVLTGDQTIYGFYLTDANGLLALAETFETPVVIHATSDAIALTPLISAGSLDGPDAFED